MNPLVKKLIRDYNYLTETLDDIKEISSVAEGAFRTAMMDHDPEAIEALNPKTQKINLEDVEIESIEESIEKTPNDPRFKKLFRKIAVKCHPDKLGDVHESEARFLKRVYEDLTWANDNYDWGMLLKLAVDLDIKYDDIDEEIINNINESVDSLKCEINKYETSMAYAWYTKNDENSRKEYLAVCANIFKKSLNKD